MSLWAEMAAHRSEVVHALVHHAGVVAMAVVLAALVAIPAGMLLAAHPRLAEPIIAVTGFLQTVPSLALLALVLPVLGIGTVPAVLALALYGLLPMLRNTYAGMRAVPEAVVDCARAMGMSPAQVLLGVQMPLAVPVIVAGIRLSTVYLISWAVLAALIGGGGLGVLIFEGLNTYDLGLILAGAVPAALMAVAAGLALGRLQHHLTPLPLRRREARGGAA